MLNTSLAYRPYRPYTSFTPHNEDEGHTSRSPRRVCNSTPLSPQSNITSLQSTALAGSSRGHTESLSPPATVSLTPTSHPSSPATAQVPSTVLVLSSSATAQVTTEDTSLNNTLMDDAPVDDAPVDDALMDEDIPTATPFHSLIPNQCLIFLQALDNRKHFPCHPSQKIIWDSWSTSNLLNCPIR
jgi:hypothetical protein